MKKRNLTLLRLNKKAIANFNIQKVKGGIDTLKTSKYCWDPRQCQGL